MYQKLKESKLSGLLLTANFHFCRLELIEFAYKDQIINVDVPGFAKSLTKNPSN